MQILEVSEGVAEVREAATQFRCSGGAEAEAKKSNAAHLWLIVKHIYWIIQNSKVSPFTIV